jgi:hypothetical protein
MVQINRCDPKLISFDPSVVNPITLKEHYTSFVAIIQLNNFFNDAIIYFVSHYRVHISILKARGLGN